MNIPQLRTCCICKLFDKSSGITQGIFCGQKDTRIINFNYAIHLNVARRRYERLSLDDSSLTSMSLLMHVNSGTIDKRSVESTSLSDF